MKPSNPSQNLDMKLKRIIKIHEVQAEKMRKFSSIGVVYVLCCQVYARTTGAIRNSVHYHFAMIS